LPTQHEAQIDAALKARGYSTASRGWPDRLCWKRGDDGSLRVACVEMKSQGAALTEMQLLVQVILGAVGIPTYVVRREADLDHLDSCASSLPGLCQNLAERLQRYVQDLGKQARNLAEAHRENRQRLLARAQQEVDDYTWVLDGRFQQLEQIVASEIQRFEELKKLFAPPSGARRQGTKS
jgi:hypothetical protein